MSDFSNMSTSLDTISNPLDGVEDILLSQECSFTRLQENELAVQAAGEQASYRLTFIWQDQHNALQLFCESDLRIPEHRQEAITRVLRSINENLWLGHFDVTADTATPCFRHTSLFHNRTTDTDTAHIEDLMEIALAESERYHAVFSLLARSDEPDEELLDLILAEPAGEA